MLRFINIFILLLLFSGCQCIPSGSSNNTFENNGNNVQSKSKKTSKSDGNTKTKEHSEIYNKHVERHSSAQNKYSKAFRALSGVRSGSKKVFDDKKSYYAKTIKVKSDKGITLRLNWPTKKIYQEMPCLLSFQFKNENFNKARDLQKFKLMLGSWDDVLLEKAYYNYFEEEKDKKGVYDYLIGLGQGWLYVFISPWPEGEFDGDGSNTDVQRYSSSFSIPVGASVNWKFDLRDYCSKDAKSLPPGEYKVWVEAKMNPINDFEGLRLTSNPITIKIHKGKPPNAKPGVPEQ